MTSQTNNLGVATREGCLGTEMEQKQKKSEREKNSNTFCRTLFKGNAIAQGMVWHEILSGPLCKRRRNK